MDATRIPQRDPVSERLFELLAGIVRTQAAAVRTARPLVPCAWDCGRRIPALPDLPGIRPLCSDCYRLQEEGRDMLLSDESTTGCGR